MIWISDPILSGSDVEIRIEVGFFLNLPYRRRFRGGFRRFPMFDFRFDFEFIAKLFPLRCPRDCVVKNHKGHKGQLD